MELSAILEVAVRGTATQTYGLGTVSNPISEGLRQSLANGEGNAQANMVHHQTVELESPGTLTATIDLEGAGGEEDSFGETSVFDAIKAIYIKNTAAMATGSSVRVGPGASNGLAAPWGASGYIEVPPGGAALIIAPGAGFTVDGTHKTVKLTHVADGTAALDVEVVFIGTDGS